MNRLLTVLVVVPLLLLVPAHAQQQPKESFDYFAANREMIRNGVQAVLLCNGLFTSERTVEQVFAQELAYLRNPVGVLIGRYGPFSETAEQGDGRVVELIPALFPRLNHELSMISRRARGVQVVIFDTKAPEPPVEAVVGRIVSQTMIENRCFPLSVVGQVVPAS